MKMKNILSIDVTLCTGCQNCELACSVRNTNSFNPKRSRIQILKDEPSNLLIPIVCLQCEVPLCEAACPTGALVTNEFGSLNVNQDVCIGCHNCITACIYGGIAVDPQSRKVVKCDLCNGDPACVLACEYGAIKLEKSDSRTATERYQGFRTIANRYGLEQEGT
jgi:Fe-S-cluster-containing dehydrogenase component